ncbi:hypothetical protein D3C75_582860 [compost metagenome]
MWWTRRPSWKPCTTVSTRYACVSRCSGGMPSWPIGKAWPAVATSRRCKPPWRAARRSCRTTSPSSPRPTSAASSCRTPTSSACSRLASAAGSATSTTAWASPVMRWSALPTYLRLRYRLTNHCWPTALSIACPGAPASHRWPRATRATAGASTCACRPTPAITASCTTWRSAAAR